MLVVKFMFVLCLLKVVEACPKLCVCDLDGTISCTTHELTSFPPGDATTQNEIVRAYFGTLCSISFNVATMKQKYPALKVVKWLDERQCNCSKTLLGFYEMQGCKGRILFFSNVRI